MQNNNEATKLRKNRTTFLRRLKRNLLCSCSRSVPSFDSQERQRERERKREKERSIERRAALRMGLSLASATADGIMTRVPQMTRDAYLMAHLPTPPSYYYVFVRVALERVREGEESVREELTKLGGGRAKKAKEKKGKLFFSPIRG